MTLHTPETRPGWREVALGEIAEIVGGSTPSTKDAANFDGEVPWLTPKDLSGPHDRYISRGERNLSQKGLDSCSAKLLPEGTVLLSTRAPVGYVAIAKNPISTNQGFRSLITREGASSEFLYYWLLHNTDELKKHSSGSTFDELSGSSLKSIAISLPPLPEQRAIAHILGTLDDKIELNRRMNETLEAMARALFKSWFVDFEPVRAKMEGRWREGESLPGLPAEHYPLFPARLVDSQLGPIPEGWGVRSLGEVIEIHDSKRIPLNSRQRAGRQGPYPYYGAAGVMDYVEDYLFEGVYVLIGEDGSVVDDGGYPIVQYVWGQFWVNNHAHVLKARSRVSLEQLYLFLKSTHIVPYVTGAVQPKLNQANLCSVPFLLPTEDVCSAFANTAGPLFQQVRIKADESHALAEQRDGLLPGLVSGEVGV